MDLPVQFPFIRLHVTVHSGACRRLAPRPANTPIYPESAVSGNRSCEQGGDGRHNGTKSTPRRCSNCTGLCFSSLYRSVPLFFVQVCVLILCTGLCLPSVYRSFFVQFCVFMLCIGLCLHALYMSMSSFFALYMSMSSFFVQVCVFSLCTVAGTWRDRHEQCCFLQPPRPRLFEQPTVLFAEETPGVNSYRYIYCACCLSAFTKYTDVFCTHTHTHTHTH